VDFTARITSRNQAVELVDALTVSSASTAPYAWYKLDRIRTYLKQSTIQLCEAYFAEETATQKEAETC
jgi:hypothetical protein